MFDWGELLSLAQELAGRSGDQAAARSAVSRAYYASFHQAKEHLLASDDSPRLSRHGAAHEQVPEHLKQPGRTRAERSAAAKLERLKRQRKWADYEASEKPRLESEVEQALRDAKFILAQLTTQPES